MALSPAGASVTTTRPVRDFRASQAEDRRRDAFASLQKFAEVPLRNVPECSDKFRRAKEAAMKSWKMFISTFDIDPDKIWLDLCRKEENDASVYCRAFLHDYVKFSERPILCLGPDETKIERSVKAAYSVQSLWRTLVLAANDTALAEKRRTDPGLKSQWSLSCHYGKNSTGAGPVWEISNWIATDLSREFDLNLEQSFVKTETTAHDILLFLTTLWTRADNIPCSRRDRVALHSVVLMASIGGFRPGTLFGLLYSQVRLAVIRDRLSKQKKLVADITIHQNKQKKNVIHTSQEHKITFSVSPNPQQIFCLFTFIAVQAIRDKAFEIPFQSVEELIHRPNMENAERVELCFKEDKKDCQIFPIKYDKGLKLWHRTLQVAGLRERVRFYANRVGAGRRLDSALTDAARNHVLSNSTAVFQRSYLSRHIPHDLASIAFGKHARDNEALFEQMRDSSLKRDPNAPIYPTKAELESFEEREDMRKLRDRYVELKKDTTKEAKLEANRVQARIGKLIEELSSLTVQEKRKKYFQEVDRRRASGMSTEDLHDPAINPQINPRKTPHAESSPAATMLRPDQRSRQKRETGQLARPEAGHGGTQQERNHGVTRGHVTHRLDKHGSK